jgi:squalene-hopene/tetraprenyl-beta-curcumene cyclase
MIPSFNRFRVLVALVLVLLASAFLRAGGESSDWKPATAGNYLDERTKTWFAFAPAVRGEGTTQTTCVSCHTLVPYALARPVLRKLAGAAPPTTYEEKLLAQTRKRVASWAELNTAPFGLLYDFNDQKKKESWGTEAISNAVVFAFDDHYQGRTTPSEVTRQAFANLWRVQVQTGNQKGSWDWLDFQYEPWESKGARYYGAALAAIAVGTAPGYYRPGADADTDTRVQLLRGYLRDGFAGQHLFNRAWALWASTKLPDMLTQAEKQALIGQLFDQQRGDGGWSLAALGNFVRRDGTPQEPGSDGYATGVVLHVLQTAGVPKNDARLARGLAWLKTNQAATGAWPSSSVNKKRDPTSHVGKFMADSATAYAVLALSH